MSEIYRSTVTDAGPLATSFLDEGMLVTFGADAPEELREFCFILAPAQTVAAIEAGRDSFGSTGTHSRSRPSARLRSATSTPSVT